MINKPLFISLTILLSFNALFNAIQPTYAGQETKNGVTADYVCSSDRTPVITFQFPSLSSLHTSSKPDLYRISVNYRGSHTIDVTDTFYKLTDYLPTQGLVMYYNITAIHKRWAVDLRGDEVVKDFGTISIADPCTDNPSVSHESGSFDTTNLKPDAFALKTSSSTCINNTEAVNDLYWHKAGHTSRYIVQKKSPNDSDFSKLEEVSNDQTSLTEVHYRDSNNDYNRVEQGKTYTYRIIAVNDQIDSNNQTPANTDFSVTTTTCTAGDPKNALSDFQMVSGTAVCTPTPHNEVAWSPAQNAVSYTVYKSVDGGNKWISFPVDGLKTTFSDPQPVTDYISEYIYQVIATKDIGEEKASGTWQRISAADVLKCLPQGSAQVQKVVSAEQTELTPDQKSRVSNIELSIDGKNNTDVFKPFQKVNLGARVFTVLSSGRYPANGCPVTNQAVTLFIDNQKIADVLPCQPYEYTFDQKSGNHTLSASFPGDDGTGVGKSIPDQHLLFVIDKTQQPKDTQTVAHVEGSKQGLNYMFSIDPNSSNTPTISLGARTYINNDPLACVTEGVHLKLRYVASSVNGTNGFDYLSPPIDIPITLPDGSTPKDGVYSNCQSFSARLYQGPGIYEFTADFKPDYSSQTGENYQPSSDLVNIFVQKQQAKDSETDIRLADGTYSSVFNNHRTFAYSQLFSRANKNVAGISVQQRNGNLVVTNSPDSSRNSFGLVVEVKDKATQKLITNPDGSAVKVHFTVKKTYNDVNRAPDFIITEDLSNGTIRTITDGELGDLAGVNDFVFSADYLPDQDSGYNQSSDDIIGAVNLSSPTVTTSQEAPAVRLSSFPSDLSSLSGDEQIEFDATANRLNQTAKFMISKNGSATSANVQPENCDLSNQNNCTYRYSLLGSEPNTDYVVKFCIADNVCDEISFTTKKSTFVPVDASGGQQSSAVTSTTDSGLPVFISISKDGSDAAERIFEDKQQFTTPPFSLSVGDNWFNVLKRYADGTTQTERVNVVRNDLNSAGGAGTTGGSEQGNDTSGNSGAGNATQPQQVCTPGYRDPSTKQCATAATCTYNVQECKPDGSGYQSAQETNCDNAPSDCHPTQTTNSTGTTGSTGTSNDSGEKQVTSNTDNGDGTHTVTYSDGSKEERRFGDELVVARKCGDSDRQTLVDVNGANETPLERCNTDGGQSCVNTTNGDKAYAACQ